MSEVNRLFTILIQAMSGKQSYHNTRYILVTTSTTQHTAHTQCIRCCAYRLLRVEHLLLDMPLMIFVIVHLRLVSPPNSLMNHMKHGELPSLHQIDLVGGGAMHTLNEVGQRQELQANTADGAALGVVQLHLALAELFV
jgi:hypothetical protein